MKQSLKEVWHALCPQPNSMDRVSRHMRGRRKIAKPIAAILAAAIVTLLALPSPGGPQNFGSTARNVFTLVEGDYLNPLVSSPRSITILNCAADSVAQFAGYDNFSSRVTIDDKARLVNVTRFTGALLSILNIGFQLSAPVADQEPGAFISESFWDEAFDRRADIIGRSFHYYGAVYRIRGVTRDYSGLLAQTDVWLPVSGRGVSGAMTCMRVLGTLHAGADWRSAQNKLIRCFDEFIPDQPFNAVPGAKLVPLETSIYFRDTAPVAIATIVKARSPLKT